MTDTDINIGEILRNERSAKKLTIEQVVEKLKIRAVYLRALESNDFATLPGGIYTEGYLRTYATFLQLDANHLCAEYNKQDDGVIASAPNRDGTIKYIRRESSPSKTVTLLTLLIAVIATIAFNYKKSPAEIIETPSLSDKLFNLYTQSEHQITILANQRVRVLLKDANKTSNIDGKQEVLFNAIMQKGNVFSFSLDNRDVILDTNNLAELDIFVEDQLVRDLDTLPNEEGGVYLKLNTLLGKIEMQ